MLLRTLATGVNYRLSPLSLESLQEIDFKYKEGKAYEAGVQRAAGPLAGVFRGRCPLNGRRETRTHVTIAGKSVFESDASQ